jgi:hypothetical protein
VCSNGCILIIESVHIKLLLGLITCTPPVCLHLVVLTTINKPMSNLFHFSLLKLCISNVDYSRKGSISVIVLSSFT